MDNTIEHTLNALSLFQRPSQLFSNTTSPSTSQSIPNPSSKLNQLDPYQEKPSTIVQIKPITPIDTSPTAINHSITPNTIENTCHSAKKNCQKNPLQYQTHKKTNNIHPRQTNSFQPHHLHFPLLQLKEEKTLSN
jgi:hypothetical protein